LLFNDMDEEFEAQHGVIFGDQRIVYRLQLFSYLTLKYQHLLDEHQLKLYAENLPKIFEHRPKIFDFNEFAAAAMHSAGIPVDIHKNLV
jgi:hypothetical protein